jgi:Family of unknown function (DUF6459)
VLSMDLAVLRLVDVPDAAPPYDCETHGASCPALGDPAPGPAGADSDLEAWIPPGPADEAGGGGTAGGSGTVGGGGAAGGAAGMTGAWPRQFAQVMVEILAGMRPLRQVVPWATDDAVARIRGLIPGFASGQRPRIQRVVTSRPAAGAVEMTVVACIGPRTRALAMRFEHLAARQAAPGLPPRPARWLCTAIEAG